MCKQPWASTTIYKVSLVIAPCGCSPHSCRFKLASLATPTPLVHSQRCLSHSCSILHRAATFLSVAVSLRAGPLFQATVTLPPSIPCALLTSQLAMWCLPASLQPILLRKMQHRRPFLSQQV